MNRLEDLPWLNIDSYPGIYTDLLALPSECIIKPFPLGAVITCPSRQDFWFGNCIALREPITSKAQWIEVARIWQTEIGQRIDAARILTRWESATPTCISGNWEGILDPDVDKFHSYMMRLDSAPGLPDMQHFRLHQYRTFEDFRSAIDITHESNADEPDSVATRDFSEWQYARHWDAVENGRARWYGLVSNIDGTHVGHCGIVQEQAVGRYQDVTIALRHRGKGFGRLLCQAVAHQSFALEAVRHLFISPDADSAAFRIYAKVGFKHVTHLHALAAPVKNY